MTALHCTGCDEYGCAGFERRAKPEPAPLPQGPGSSEAARRLAIQAAAEAVRAAKEHKR